MKQLTRRKRADRRRRAGRDGDTERRILDAAHAVFVRRGTAGARMQEIAAEARVNQALLHYYFRTKERLAKAAFERAAAQLMPAVIRMIASDAALEEKVTHIVDLYLDQLTRAPYLPGYIISEVTHHPERVAQLIGALSGLSPGEIRSRVLGALDAQIGAGVAAGTLRPIAPESFMVNLMALCIFPFAASPMIKAVVGMDDRGFAAFIDRRRRELPAFFLGALRP
jgi:AcrR family transcriptional regulator